MKILREKKEKEKTLRVLREKKEKEKLVGAHLMNAAGCQEVLFAYSGGPSLSRYHWWNRLQSSSEWVRSWAEIHEVSSSVPS